MTRHVRGIFCMSDYVNFEDKKILSGNQGFNDKEQRLSFKKMVQKNGCPILRQYLINYFNMKDDKTYKIIDDPIGKYKVDLGIKCVETNEIVGLVEVDYFKKWNQHEL